MGARHARGMRNGTGMTDRPDSANTASGMGAPDLIAALTDESGLVSALERKLAASILADVSFATNASITEIAARAGVSPPTVTRFCRRLGCASFSDFKLQLAKSAYVGLRYLRPESVTSTPAEVAEDIVTKAQNALFEMHRGLNLDALSQAANLLAGAQMIYAFGSGGNSSMIIFGALPSNKAASAAFWAVAGFFGYQPSSTQSSGRSSATSRPAMTSS